MRSDTPLLKRMHDKLITRVPLPGISQERTKVRLVQEVMGSSSITAVS